MKRKGYLFEDICSYENLIRAAYKASRGKTSKQAVAKFILNLEFNVLDLQKELLSESYHSLSYRSFYIHEPKMRHICAADFRDRVVHHAICNYLEPIFEKMFIYDSYACRKDKGAHKAVRRVQSFCCKSGFFLKADVERFFDSIDHMALKALLGKRIKDRALLGLMERIIDQPYPGQIPGKGVPIGNLTSQWLANFYLDKLDHYIKDVLGVKKYVRYMDDFIILADNKEALHLIKADIMGFLEKNLLLKLKQSATYIAPVRQGITFLGFRIFPNLIRLKRENRVRFFRNYDRRKREYLSGNIDEETFVRSVASMIGHLYHADSFRMRQKYLINQRTG